MVTFRDFEGLFSVNENITVQGGRVRLHTEGTQDTPWNVRISPVVLRTRAFLRSCREGGRLGRNDRGNVWRSRRRVGLPSNISPHTLFSRSSNFFLCFKILSFEKKAPQSSFSLRDLFRLFLSGQIPGVRSGLVYLVLDFEP